MALHLAGAQADWWGAGAGPGDPGRLPDHRDVTYPGFPRESTECSRAGARQHDPGAILLTGAVLRLLLVRGIGMHFYCVPSVLGLTYLVAAAVNRSREASCA